MNPVNNKTVQFDVGGESFTFAKETLSKPHVKNTIFGMAVSGNWSELPYIEADPSLFKKWCAPHIRSGTLPVVKELDVNQRSELVEAANRLGLLALANHVKQSDDQFVLTVNKNYINEGIFRELNRDSFKIIVCPRTKIFQIWNEFKKTFFVIHQRSGDYFFISKSKYGVHCSGKLVEDEDVKEEVWSRAILIKDGVRFEDEKTVDHYGLKRYDKIDLIDAEQEEYLFVAPK